MLWSVQMKGLTSFLIFLIWRHFVSNTFKYIVESFFNTVCYPKYCILSCETFARTTSLPTYKRDVSKEKKSMIHIINQKKHQNQLDLATNCKDTDPTFVGKIAANRWLPTRKTAGKVGHDASRSADRTSTQTAPMGSLLLLRIEKNEAKKWNTSTCYKLFYFPDDAFNQGFIQKISENI